MVKFDKAFIERMLERMAKFARFDEKGDVSSRVAVTVTKGDNLRSEARPEKQDFSWASDENGPSPLSYFISSLGMCQMVHYAEHAASEGIAITDLSIRVEGKFKISRPREFTNIDYEVSVTSPDSVDAIRKLALNAASDCYVTNTLSKACSVRGSLVLNGNPVGPISPYASE
ncbi:OsmC family protein [Thermoplasmatales archaeon AK]|nr:OsmC family protein [Thermoplasmatales archaeon AK]